MHETKDPRIGHDDGVDSGFTDPGEIGGHRLQVVIAGKDVQSQVDLLHHAVGQGRPFGHLVESEVPCPVPEVEGFAADIDGIGAVMKGETEFFKIPGRGQEFRQGGVRRVQRSLSP